MNRYFKKYSNFDDFCKEFHSIDELYKWYKANKVQWPDIPASGDGNDRPMSWPDDIIRTKRGNCWDHAILMHYFCLRNNIPHTILHIQNFVESKDEYWCMGHAIGLYQIENGWNFFNIQGRSELSNELGPYKSIDEAVKKYIVIYSNMIYNIQGFNSNIYNIGKKSFWSIANDEEYRVYDKYYNNHKLTQNEISEEACDSSMKRKYGMRYPMNKKINRGWISTMSHNIKKWISDNIGRPLYDLGLPTNETGLMGSTGTAIASAYGTPFVMQVMDPAFVRPKYAIANDLVTDKIVSAADDDTLKLMNSDDYLKGKKVKIFKYKGSDGKVKIQKILESLGKQVPRSFIYETVSGKEMITDDQIYLDQDFEEVDFSTLRHVVENEAYSVLNKYIQSIPTLASKFNIVNTEEASLKLKDYSDSIVIMENENLGYFACNKNTLRRTKYYDNIQDIMIGSDISDS